MKFVAILFFVYSMKEFISKQKQLITAIGLWVVIFSGYIQTLAPSVGFIDSGELGAVVGTLGIAHPTGYPLFTLLGRVFTMLPVAAEEIVRLNILSALLTSLSAIVFFFFINELLAGDRKKEYNSTIIASAFATLALAFSKTFWSQSVSVEVYSFHLVLLCSILFAFIKAIHTDQSRWWILVGFLVGLSFTNHLSTILLAPALLYWFFVEHGFHKGVFRKIITLAIPFLAGLSVYLYVPIRAAQQPPFNWGNPQTFEKFWWHFTGKQFRVWMFSSGDAAKKQLDYFFDNLPHEYVFVMLALAVVGVSVLLFTNRRIFVFVLLLFISCVGYAINYDIHDIDSYFLLAFVSIAVCIAIGVSKILERFENVPSKIVLIAVLTGFLVVQIIDNQKKVDQSENYLVEDYTKNILLNLPRNSIVLSYQWDYFVAASYYFQHIKNIRPDVVVLDKELFRRSWYFPQLEKLYPALMKKSVREVDLFQQELFKFEHDLPYDYSSIEGRYTTMLKSFIEKNDSASFYVTPEIEQQYTSGYHRIPEGLLFRITKDTSYIQAPFPQIQFRDFAGNDVYAKQIKSFTMNGLLRRSAYEKLNGRDSLSTLYRQNLTH